MKIVNDNPPNIDDIKALFVIPDSACFTYGNTLYVPNGAHIDDALFAHEETHERQQAILTPEKWWKFYLLSPEFRISQEVEAYQNQYRVMKERIHNREELNRALLHLAKALAGPMYGNSISVTEATAAIRSRKRIIFDLTALPMV